LHVSANAIARASVCLLNRSNNHSSQSLLYEQLWTETTWIFKKYIRRLNNILSHSSRTLIIDNLEGSTDRYFGAKQRFWGERNSK
jgi:hypothetical protein